MNEKCPDSAAPGDCTCVVRGPIERASQSPPGDLKSTHLHALDPGEQRCVHGHPGHLLIPSKAKVPTSRNSFGSLAAQAAKTPQTLSVLMSPLGGDVRF